MISANIPKVEADYLYKIDNSRLRKRGFFNGWCSGAFAWIENKTGERVVVELEVSTNTLDKYLIIRYPQKGDWINGENQIDCKVEVVSTECRYGGERYWFLCPNYNNGKQCSRRVAMLYKKDGYFACRHCHNLTYLSRNLSGKHKQFGGPSRYEVQEIGTSLRQTHYAGKPTKAPSINY